MNRTFSSPDNNNNNEKIEYFSKTVKLNIDEQIRQIENEMKDYRENFIKNETITLENEITEYYNKNISDIDVDIKIKLSRIKIEKKHEYLKIRDDLQNKLFKDLEKKLIEFIGSPEYKDFLIRSCERCVNTFDKNSQIIVYISNSDKDKIQMIEEYLQNKINFTIEINHNIKFGGLYYYDTTNNIVLNETIDERLLQEKLHFNQ